MGVELSALAKRLAKLRPKRRIDGSDSWLDEDLKHFKAAVRHDEPGPRTAPANATRWRAAGLPKPGPRPLHLNPSSRPVGTKVPIWGHHSLSPSVTVTTQAGTGATQESFVVE
jgi:hypothetical protein